jgi:aspartokinase
MAMYVYKFGGTSVGTVERIKAVAEKVKAVHDSGDQLVIVLSAMSGATTTLPAAKSACILASSIRLILAFVCALSVSIRESLG